MYCNKVVFSIFIIVKGTGQLESAIAEVDRNIHDPVNVEMAFYLVKGNLFILCNAHNIL